MDPRRRVLEPVSVQMSFLADPLLEVLSSVTKSLRSAFRTGLTPSQTSWLVPRLPSSLPLRLPKIATLLVAAGLLVLWVASPALAQSQGSNAQGVGQRETTRSNIASYYYYAEPGDLTMQVNVWGTVRNPGRYEVQTGTDLGELLSFAGGPQLTRMREQDERTITIRVSRVTDSGRNIVYESTLDSLITTPQAYPVMEGGDVVTIETIEDPGFTWQDAIGTIGSVASIGLLVVRAIEIGG